MFCAFIFAVLLPNFGHTTRWGSKQSHSHRAYIVTFSFSFMWPLKPNHELIPILNFRVTQCHDLTIQGHVTSSVTWPFESQWAISYWWSIGPKSLSLTDSEILCPKHHVPIGTMLNRHWLDISHIYCVPYLPRELYNRPDPFPSLMA